MFVADSFYRFQQFDQIDQTRERVPLRRRVQHPNYRSRGPLPIDFTLRRRVPRTLKRCGGHGMPPRLLLKAELVAYRNSMRPARYIKKGEPIEPGPIRNTADVQLLDRWIERCDRENLEERLWKTLHAMTAPELIRLELLARRKAGAAVNQIYGTKWGTPSFDEVRRILQKRPPQKRKRIVQIAGGGVIVELSKEWRDIKIKLTDNLSLANLDILERGHDMHITYSHLMSDFNNEPRQPDDSGTRLKRLFWDFMGSYLYIRFGKWFDNEVAILTEIAFGLDDGSVDPRHINYARRQR